MTDIVLSVILPVLNEADIIGEHIARLQHPQVEVIVVDGGSQDDTVSIAQRLPCHVVQNAPGRARQMNAGANIAQGQVFMFLHADTQLPDNFVDEIKQLFLDSNCAWGRFDVRLSGGHPGFRMIETLMNLRSRLTQVCTGDQAIFVKRDLFERVGGFCDMPLMEDIEISKRLRTLSKPFCISQPLTTSSRRWEQQGILKTILLMWQLRWLYFTGTSPEVLAEKYKLRQ